MGKPFLKERCLSGSRWIAKFSCLGLVFVAMSAASGAGLITASSAADARSGRLAAFFGSYQCPGPLHIEDYLRAADTYGIDYRLLPALSVRESTCGRHERANNRWGWDSARTGFASVANGIEFIARQLALGRSYRGKTLEQKLRTYNPNPLYTAEIRKLMRQIEAD
jgi:hypothetical protein